MIFVMKKKYNQTVTAGGIIINELQEFVVVNQNHDSWSLPKGHVEKNETILDAAKREIYEELSYNNLECRPLVGGSMGTQPVWSDLYGETRMKNSDIIEQYGMYVPNHQDLNEQDILRICSILNKGVAI